MAPRRLSTLAAVLTLAGCVQPAIRPEAFDRGQKGALLALQAAPAITPWGDAAGAEGPALDAAEVLAAVRPIVVDALGKNPHFRLVPEAKVFAAPTYAALPAADPQGRLSAPGYRPVADEGLYPTIAREAGAEMGLSVSLNLVYRADDGAAGVVVNAGAIDVKGRGVWRGAAAILSEKSVDVRTASAKARNDAFRDAARKAMAQLEEGLSEQLAFEIARGRTGR